ncbi:unnamed protein product [Mytilus coruscus]|uniref:Uncharacterized protein n=1 Tax=Mytilus coruscus TaxID=42192 RepID=A0A6J8EXG8_MYTCO|nr:unnamed protein product [Mytilus coruscus]
MNAEELLSEQIMENINIDDEASEVNGSLQEKKRERLSSVVAGGSSKQYLGKELQLSDIDKMTTEQINKLYCKYEARLGASMTKTLGNSFINLYVMGVSKFFKVVNPPILIQDLEEDPFINNALTNTCCELKTYRTTRFARFPKKDENNDIKMMNENPEQKRNKEEKKKYLKTQTKRPKRVAAGKKGAEGIACRSNKMASALAMMLGGAITNAFAFSGSNYLFSHMGSNANEEKIRHDKAIEKLEKHKQIGIKEEYKD